MLLNRPESSTRGMCLQAIWYVILCYYDADTSLWCWISTSLWCRNDGLLHDLTSLQSSSTRHQHGHRGQTGSAAQQHSTLWTLDMRRHTQGVGELSNYLYCAIYSLYAVDIHAVRIYTPHTKTRQQKAKEPSAARGLGDKDWLWNPVSTWYSTAPNQLEH